MVHRARPNSAFTLIEMLVALALIGILATALYSSLHIGFDARSRAEASIAPVRTATLALELLRRDTASALPPTGILAGAFIGADGTAEDSAEDADALELCSAGEDLERGGQGIRKLEFLLIPSEDGLDSTLVRRVTANLLAPVAPDPYEEVLCRHVVSLNLRYFDGAAWLDAWDSTLQDNALPLAIEASIQIRTPDSTQAEPETRQLTRVFPLPCGVLPGAGGETQGSSRT